MRFPRLTPAAWAGVALVALALVCMLLVHGRSMPVLDRSQVTHPVGAFHIHSADSHDSEVAPEAFVDAARALGLDFIVLTDHNNQRPHPQTRESVTVLSYAELSTGFGHVVQLGAPYTLGVAERNAPNVLSAIRSTGGAPIITHPSDIKRPWVGSLDNTGGLEIANVAASARRAAQPMFIGLLPQVLAWPMNRTAVMSSLYDRDTAALAMWDEQPNPQVVGLCGADAHGWIAPALNLKTWYVVLDVALPEGDGRAAAILDALRTGRFHCVAALFGRDPEFAFNAWHGGEAVGGAGDTVVQEQTDALSITAASTDGGDNQIVLLRNGAEISRTSGRTLRYANPAPGAYRVEILAPVPNLVIGSRWLPVIYSNRLQVVVAPPPPPQPDPPPTTPAPVEDDPKPTTKHDAGHRESKPDVAKKHEAKHDGSKHESSRDATKQDLPKHDAAKHDAAKHDAKVAPKHDVKK